MISPSLRGYLKNHWTNTYLCVYTFEFLFYIESKYGNENLNFMFHVEASIELFHLF